MTLDRDVSDIETMERHILQLSEMVGRRASGGYAGRTIALTLRYPDFTTFTRRSTVGMYMNTSINIYITAKEILQYNTTPATHTTDRGQCLQPYENHCSNTTLQHR